MTLTFFCFILLICRAAFAVMPPEHYDSRARQSRIKAVAVVEKVIVLAETKENTYKKIVFKLEKGLEKNIPERFSGTCYSIDHHWQVPSEGGLIYYYPSAGQKVLVSVSDNGGDITSFTPLDQALEREINKHRLSNISFKMGKVQIKESAGQ